MSNYKTLDDVKRVISLGKSQSVIDKFWKSYQEGLQHQAWLEQMQADYDLLFPETEEVTATDDDGNPVTETVAIDYSNNPDYLPFGEWMQVREVLTGTRTVIDADGNEVPETYEYEGDLLREFVADQTSFTPFANSEFAVIVAKASKNKAIKSLTVTVDTFVFDADPVARQNMADAILASDTTGITETTWKMADNSFQVITIAQLRQASALAIQEVGKLVVGG